MVLQKGGNVRFAKRPVQGVTFPSDQVPVADKLILDGQQRLTTLTQVLRSKNPGSTVPALSGHLRRQAHDLSRDRRVRDAEGLARASRERPTFATLHKDPLEFTREMRTAAAVKWYELELVSEGRAAEIAGMT